MLPSMAWGSDSPRAPPRSPTRRHIFGTRGDIVNNVFHVDDRTVLYPAGHYIVVLDMVSRTQQFLPGSHESGGITAVDLSRSRKYLAVADYGERGSLSIYDLTTLKRRKHIISSEVGSKEYVAMAFSPDEKYLVAQGGSPEWNAVLFMWEKGKVIHSARMSTPTTPVRSVSFSPVVRDGCAGTFYVAGAGFLRQFVIEGSTVSEVSQGTAKRPQTSFMCMTHLTLGGAGYVPPPSPTRGGEEAEAGEEDDEEVEEPPLVCGTDQGEMLVVENGEVTQLLARTDGPGAITSICSYSRGFVAGGTDGMVCVVETTGDEETSFRVVKQLAVGKGEGAVVGISMAPGERELVVTTSDNQAFRLTLQGLDLGRGDEIATELLSAPFHDGAISGLDTCARKPIAATCSVGGAVRIWNYQDSTCELSKDFVEEAYSVALHPSGYLLSVGFADKLRLMTVLMEDLRVVKEFNIKACRECQFSNGGQLLAAVNGSTISVYSTYNGENVANLRGHNGKVSSIVWSEDDSKLLTTGGDGAIYMWHMDDHSRDKDVDYVLKGCVYNCLAATPDFKAFFAVGSDRLLKEIDGVGKVINEIKSAEVLTQVVLPVGARSMFASTDSGIVRAYRYPLTGECQVPEAKPHHGKITRMRLSRDSAVLFAAGEDGCVSVHDVRDVQSMLVADKERDVLPWAEEVLVTKSDLEERKRQMTESENKLQNDQMDFEYEKRLKETQMHEEVKTRTNRYMEELEKDKDAFERLLQEKNELEMQYEQMIKDMDEKHQHRLSQLDSQFQQKIMEEVEKWQELTQDKDTMMQEWSEQQAMMNEQHEKAVEELTEKFDAELDAEHQNIENLENEKADMQREFEEMQKQMYEDFDKEIEDLKARYQRILDQEKEVSLGLKGENGIMKKKFQTLKKEIQEKEAEMGDMRKKLIDLDKTIESTAGECA